MKNQPEFVFIGKGHASKQRAEVRKKELLDSGYTIKSENSKSITFSPPKKKKK